MPYRSQRQVLLTELRLLGEERSSLKVVLPLELLRLDGLDP